MGAEDSFFYREKNGSESGEKRCDTGGTIRHAGEISRKGQEIERKRGELYTCARLCSVAVVKRTRGDH